MVEEKSNKSESDALSALDDPFFDEHNPEDDGRAYKEAAGLARGWDLANAKSAKELNDVVRQDRLEGVLNVTIRRFVLFAAVLVSISALVLVFHYIAPGNWLFLTPERIDELRDFLFSGTVGAAITQLARGSLGDRAKN